MSEPQKSNDKPLGSLQVNVEGVLPPPLSNKSELEFVNAMDYLPLGIRIINADHTIQYTNPAFAELAGITPGEAFGKKCWEIFPDQFCHTLQCRLERIKEGETSIQTEIERVRQDGSKIPCMLSVFPLYTPDKQLIGIIESFRDINYKRRLEADAEEAKDRYNAIVGLSGQVGEGILMIQDINGMEGAITFASDQCSLMTGFTNEELLGKTAFELISSKDRNLSIERHRRKMKGESLPGLYEMTMIRKDGSELTVEINSAITHYNGKMANVVFLRDITERKALESSLNAERDKYRSLFNNAPVAIAEGDQSETKKVSDNLRRQGISEFRQYFSDNPGELYRCFKSTDNFGFNQAFLDICEANTADEVKTLVGSWFRQGTTIDNAHADTIIRLAEGQTRFSKEETITTAKGQTRHIHTNVVVAPGHEDTLSRVLISFADITDLVNQRQELKQHKENLEELVRIRTAAIAEQIKRRIDFNRLLVHELKTPLTAMLSSSDILVNDLQDAEMLKLAKNINKGCLTLDGRIDELLDIAKSEIGMLTVRRSRIDPEALIKEVSQEVLPAVKRKKQKLILDLPRTLPWIWGDKERLDQVILNLIDNALKFNRQHGTIILRVDRNEGFLIISIVDEGKGIKAAERERIFEPYHRIESGPDNFSGLGLGLALSKSLVELHQGKIWVESAEGKGSTFSFSIPLANQAGGLCSEY